MTFVQFVSFSCVFFHLKRGQKCHLCTSIIIRHSVILVYALKLPAGSSFVIQISQKTILWGLLKNGFSNIAAGFKITSHKSFPSRSLKMSSYQSGQSGKKKTLINQLQAFNFIDIVKKCLTIKFFK